MKQTSIILVLAFLLIAIPISFKAQTKKKTTKTNTQKIERISEEAQVKKIVEKFIDGVFVKRDFPTTFQELFSFAPCDNIDKEVLDQNCTVEKFYPVKLNSKQGLRAISVIFNHQFLPFYLILGTIPIKKSSEESYPYYSSDFEKLESKILKKNNSSIHDIDYEKLTPKQFEQKIIEMEKINNEIDRIILKRIDSAIYKKNIEIMKETITVEKEIESNRKYYSVYMKGLVYYFILTERNGEFKIVGIDNPI